MPGSVLETEMEGQNPERSFLVLMKIIPTEAAFSLLELSGWVHSILMIVNKNCDLGFRMVDRKCFFLHPLLECSPQSAEAAEELGGSSSVARMCSLAGEHFLLSKER